VEDLTSIPRAGDRVARRVPVPGPVSAFYLQIRGVNHAYYVVATGFAVCATAIWPTSSLKRTWEPRGGPMGSGFFSSVAAAGAASSCDVTGYGERGEMVSGGRALVCGASTASDVWCLPRSL